MTDDKRHTAPPPRGQGCPRSRERPSLLRPSLLRARGRHAPRSLSSASSLAAGAGMSGGDGWLSDSGSAGSGSGWSTPGGSWTTRGADGSDGSSVSAAGLRSHAIVPTTAMSRIAAAARTPRRDGKPQGARPPRPSCLGARTPSSARSPCKTSSTRSLTASTRPSGTELDALKNPVSNSASRLRVSTNRRQSLHSSRCASKAET